MIMTAEPFERIADLVTTRAADVLDARVSMLDERGAIVASTDRRWSDGMARGERDASGEEPLVRVHVDLCGHPGAVVVDAALSGETAISPRLAHKLVELIVAQTAAVAQMPDAQEVKHKFIHDLLHGSAGDEASVLREGQILGMDLTRPRAVILIDASAYIGAGAALDRTEVRDARASRRAQLLIASIVGFFKLPNDTICAYIGNGEIAVLKASTTQDLFEWSDDTESSCPASASWADLSALKRAARALLARLGHDTGATVGIGLGRYHPGVHGLARSYQDARAALALGRHLNGQDRVHCLDALGIAAFVGVSDEQTKVELAAHLLSPLDQERELMETLEAFFACNCCMTTTAQRVSVHRNTLGYRFDKIALLTGLDPRHFDDAVQIRLALVLRSLPQMPG